MKFSNNQLLEIQSNGQVREHEREINILYLEDNPNDVDLLEIELSKHEGFTLHAVNSREDFEEAIDSDYDVIILDFQLPDFDGKRALRLLNEYQKNTPVIILSGTVGEEEAVSMMHQGASDFILKDNLRKIPRVIKRVIEASDNKARSQSYLREIEEKNALLDSILNGLDDLMFFKDPSFKYMKVNQAFCDHFHISESAVIGRTDRELFDNEIVAKSESSDRQVFNFAKSSRFLTEYHDENGKKVITETVKTPIIRSGNVIGLVGISRDVTRKRLLEQQLRKNQLTLSQAEEMTNAGSFEFNADLEILNCTPNLGKILGLEKGVQQISLNKLYKLIYEPDRPLFIEQMEEAIGNKTPLNLYHRIDVQDQVKFCRTWFKPDLTSEYHICYGTIAEISQEYMQEEATDSTLESERRRISRELHDGVCQKLVATTMLLDSARSKGENELISNALDLVRESVDEIRAISRNLSVKMVEENGLEYALKEVLNRIPNEIHQEVSIDIDENDIGKVVGSQLFRITQEAVNNMLKYAHASKFIFSLKQEDSILQLIIQDNGIGCNKKGSDIKGNGIKNITCRVKRCHGIIRIDCIKNGFKIDIKIPIR